jgi:ribonuclease D
VTTSPLRLIENSTEFETLLRRLCQAPMVAIDTEAASFHRYRDRVYLVQVSTRGETHLIDPLAVPGLPGFGELLADPAIEKVFHDADYDLRLLGYEFGFKATNLFDTRVAAQFLNEPGIGLAALLEKHIGVTPDKRFQRADWSARPLSQPMLEYAAMDTRHLPDLRDLMRDKLVARGRLEWVLEECALLTAVRWPDPVPSEEAALTVKGVRALTPRAQALFRELYLWRARTAEALDRAAFRVMGNETLVALAQQPPADQTALVGVKGVGRDIAERRGTEIMAAVRRGLELPDAELPRLPRGPRRRPDPVFDVRLERLKALRTGLAAREDLAPGVLCPNWLLEAIARAAPATLEELGQVEGIRRWQVGAIGPDLLKVIPVT